jgi:hypothetical protein
MVNGSVAMCSYPAAAVAVIAEGATFLHLLAK